jgi:hypothetical protein
MDGYLLTTPWLRIRDGFVGGRTQPARMFFNPENNSFNKKYKIRYLDYTSLYPWSQTQSYPLGHPDAIIVKKEARDVYWTNPSQISYYGFVKVVVNAPRCLPNSPPVLPIKVDERLLFSLCRKCSVDIPNGGKMSDYRCSHTDEERKFIWTGTTTELGAALEQGYIVTKIFIIANQQMNCLKDMSVILWQ